MCLSVQEGLGKGTLARLARKPWAGVQAGCHAGEGGLHSCQAGFRPQRQQGAEEGVHVRLEADWEGGSIRALQALCRTRPVLCIKTAQLRWTMLFWSHWYLQNAS